MTPEDGGEPGSGPLRALGGMTRRIAAFFGGGRVLQIEELRAGFSEYLEGHALTGLRLRYLPATVTIGVSPSDHRFLAPFAAEVATTVSEELSQRTRRGGWKPTVGEPRVDLVADRSLRPRSRPVFLMAYPPPKKSAVWAPAESAAARNESGSAALILVLTVSAGEGTAIQERLEVFLGPQPPSFLEGEEDLLRGLRSGPGSGEPGIGGRFEPGTVAVCDPPSETATAGVLTGGRCGRWVRGTTPGGIGFVWCPSGPVVLGREPGAAHVVPSAGVPQMSGAHAALELGDDGGLRLADLASTNGTRLNGRPVPPAVWTPLSLPARVSIGADRLSIEIRWEEGESDGARRAGK